jgi:voltage-gated potassium channel
MVAETVEPIHAAARGAFSAFEVFSVGVFTAEYMLRLWSCTESPRFARPVRGRLRWMVTPMAIVDLLAVLPFYLPFLGADLRIIRILRLFRLFRILKLARYSRALHVIGGVIREKREELLMSCSFLLVLMLVASALMYFAEHEAQPDRFSSIPAAAWWAVVTLTTVGYGDIYPVTPLGRFIGGATAILGIAMLALPTGILGSGFIERFNKEREDPRRCPHCGKEISAPPPPDDAKVSTP